jgi:hypothetical protein
MEALTQLDLELDVEEVGREDCDPTTIVNFCRKSMGIYDFQLSVEQLEELGCTPKEVRLVLRYLCKSTSQTLCMPIALVVAIGYTPFTKTD